MLNLVAVILNWYHRHFAITAAELCLLLKQGKDVSAVDSPVSYPEKNLALEENVMNDNSGRMDDDDGVHFSILPIYVYNCPLTSVMEQLVNRWTYNRPADIFEDLTFEV